MMRERSKPNENASKFQNFCPPLHFPKPFRGPVYRLCLVESGKQTQMVHFFVTHQSALRPVCNKQKPKEGSNLMVREKMSAYMKKRCTLL